MSLCGACTDALSPELLSSGADNRSLLHHLSIGDFLHAVQNKCGLCWRAYNRLGSDEKSELSILASKNAETSGGLAAVLDTSTPATRLHWDCSKSESGSYQLSLSLEIAAPEVHLKNVLVFFPTQRAYKDNSQPTEPCLMVCRSG
jgi:hypothetical protein